MRTPATLALLGAILAGCESGPEMIEENPMSRDADTSAAISLPTTRVIRPAAADAPEGFTWPAGLPRDGGISHYVANRPPLTPSPFAKLPIGAIRPRGWLKEQLRLQAEGFVGRLPELSAFCRADSGWLDDTSRQGWEEMPYWLKGFADTGYLLEDARIIEEARKWIEAGFRSQQADGYFGPAMNRRSYDLWPNMVMLFCLQSYYEWKSDPRVLELMSKYFRYQLSLPPERLLPGSWQRIRGGDNLQSVYWLYNRTGEAWLLDVAQRIHEATDNWSDTVPNWWHGVNLCQGFREPGDFWQQSKERRHLEAPERNWRAIYREFGQQPGGMFGADENCRPGKTDPCQAAETCSMVEMMYSCQSLLKAAGDPVWADRCEDVAFNSLPASMTPDLKSLHYLTAPNLVLCDKGGAHNFQNQGEMVAFNPFNYRCCQHNVAQGWPYHIEHLWLATQGDGLAAVLYAPCVVKAKVGAEGTEIGIVEETDYPFGETVEFKIAATKPVRFGLSLRIPGWCRDAVVSVNGARQDADAAPGAYVTIDREWRSKDVVRLTLPMRLAVRVWDRMKNAVSVDRGPLSFSLQIKEKWAPFTPAVGVPAGTTPETLQKWMGHEVLPDSPWNYGLAVDPKNPDATLQVVRKTGPPADQPFTHEAAPISIRARGRRIPGWQIENATCGELRPGPIRSEEPEEEITLIPMGCARLRISSFPVIGDGPDARDWASGEQFIKTWMVAGPFPNDGNRGFATAYPPEQEVAAGLDFKKTYDGAGGPAAWKRVDANGKGLVDLLAHLTPKENVAAYAYCVVEAPGAQDASLMLGSDDSVVAWLNGEKVHANEIARGAEPDQDEVKIRLKQGRNTILLKVCQGVGGWGFYGRLSGKRTARLAYPDPEKN